MGSCRQVKTAINSDSSSSTVPSVCDMNRYNPQGKPRVSLEEVLYPMQSY